MARAIALIFVLLGFLLEVEAEMANERLASAQPLLPPVIAPGKLRIVAVSFGKYSGGLDELKGAYSSAFEVATALKQHIPHIGKANISIITDFTGDYTEKVELERGLSGEARILPEQKPASDYNWQKEIVKEVRRGNDSGEKNSDTFVFYFLGHGEVESGKDYLHMSGSQGDPEDRVLLQEIIDRIQERKESKKIVVLDKCRQARRRRGLGPSSAPKDKESRQEAIEAIKKTLKSTVVLWSTSGGTEAYYDDEQKKGFFTKHLLKGLNCQADGIKKDSAKPEPDGILSLQELYLYTSRELDKDPALKKERLEQEPALTVPAENQTLDIDIGECGCTGQVNMPCCRTGKQCEPGLSCLAGKVCVVDSSKLDSKDEREDLARELYLRSLQREVSLGLSTKGQQTTRALALGLQTAKTKGNSAWDALLLAVHRVSPYEIVQGLSSDASQILSSPRDGEVAIVLRQQIMLRELTGTNHKLVPFTSPIKSAYRLIDNSLIVNTTDGQWFEYSIAQRNFFHLPIKREPDEVGLQPTRIGSALRFVQFTEGSLDINVLNQEGKILYKHKWPKTSDASIAAIDGDIAIVETDYFTNVQYDIWAWPINKDTNNPISLRKMVKSRVLHKLAYNRRSNRIAITTSNNFTGSNSIEVWEIRNHDVLQLARLEGHTKPVESLDFSPDGDTLVSISDDTIRVWDVTAETAFRVLDSPSPGPRSVALTSAARYLLTLERDGKTKLWPLHQSPIRKVPVITSDKTAIRFCATGKLFYVTTGMDDAVQVFAADDVSAPRRVISLVGMGTRADGDNLQFSPDCSLIGFLPQKSESLLVWHTESNKPVVLLKNKGPVKQFQFSADSKRVFVLSGQSQMTTWYIENGRHGLEFNLSGKGSTEKISFFDVDPRSEQRLLAVSPKSIKLLSMSADSSSDPIAILQHDFFYFRSASFFGDNEILINSHSVAQITKDTSGHLSIHFAKEFPKDEFLERSLKLSPDRNVLYFLNGYNLVLRKPNGLTVRLPTLAADIQCSNGCETLSWKTNSDEDAMFIRHLSGNSIDFRPAYAPYPRRAVLNPNGQQMIVESQKNALYIYSLNRDEYIDAACKTLESFNREILSSDQDIRSALDICAKRSNARL